MPFELNPIASQLSPQEFLPHFGFFEADLRCPLKRGVRLWHKGRDTGSDLSTMIASRGHFAAQINDATQILLGFGWQAEHEIELHTLPAQTKEHMSGFDQLLFLIFLLDYVA